MGCFSTCFPKSKQRRSRRAINPKPRLDQVLQVDEDAEAFQTTRAQEEEGNVPQPDINIKDEKQREKLNISGRKKVTFDPNVKVYEGLPAEEEEDAPLTNDFGLLIKDYEITEGEKNNKKKQLEKAAGDVVGKEGKCNSDSSSSSLFSYPPPTNYRYQNCRDSDDELDDEIACLSGDESEIDDYLGDDDDADEDEDDNEVVECKLTSKRNSAVAKEEESSESLFSLSVDSRRHRPSEKHGDDKEVNSPMPTKTQLGFDSVLNPVENLTQWKAVKARAKLVSRQQQQAKENIDSISQEPHLKSTSAQKKQEMITVDTSLSSWLGVVGSETAITTTPTKNKIDSVSVGNSPASARASSSPPVSFEDRPILGALTLDEIKQFSANSSPRKSPTRSSPDDMPIIGTVGSYWSHTGQYSDSSGSAGNSSIKTRFRAQGTTRV